MTPELEPTPAAPASRLPRLALQIALPIVLLGGGFAVYKAMQGMSAKAEQHAATRSAIPVSVVAVTRAERASQIDASGTVQADSRVDLVAQVTGRVVYTADGLAPGRRFRRGEVLARIDDRDFQAQVVQAEAALSQARLDLALEESRGRQAAREWELLGETPETALAKREIQLQVARANVASAESRLTVARLALERTRLVAPFDAVLISESLDVGQVVGPGAPVAALYGSDRLRVRVSVSLSELAMIDVPEQGRTGSKAVIRQDRGDGSSIERVGQVVGLFGELDADTRTPSLLVAIDHPFDVDPGEMPILPGAFVDVLVDGRAVTDVIGVPRDAVRDGNVVWIVRNDGQSDVLARRPLDIAWRDATSVWVRGGLEPGDRVVTSPLALPIDGLPVVVEGSAGGAPPSTGADPGATGADPGAVGADPGAVGADPGAPGADPGAPGADPGAGAPGADPGAGAASPPVAPPAGPATAPGH